jgi:putative ABC transport system permease protein
MLARDFVHLALRALAAHRLRSFLTLLGIAVGIAAVILLTSIGEGIHRFILAEFTQFGTNVMEISPGRKGAKGGPPGLPSTARELTLEDAAALARLPGVVGVTPIVWGSSEVEANGRLRRTTIYGAGPNMPQVFAMQISVGQFLPPDDPEHARPLVVLGTKIKRELFGNANALGERLRIGGKHFRVIGVVAPKGQFLGTDLDDTAFIPAARAMALYNRSGLMTINLSYAEGLSPTKLASASKNLLSARHGREDFTITTQEDMLKTLSKILNILTAAVGALGGISLLVGAVGIVTIMTIAVSERTGEIGLLVALGAARGTILSLFLAEAVALATIGGLVGLSLGSGLAALVGWALPALPVRTPWVYVVLAEVAALVLGLSAGVLPALRASRLKAVEALRAE